MKYRIQINMHQILKIFIVTACHRINSLIRISHCIQECIQRSLCQFDKGILYRKILRSFQYGMFQNMRYAGTVSRRRPKTDIEHLVLILVGKKRKPCTRFFMTH